MRIQEDTGYREIHGTQLGIAIDKRGEKRDTKKGI